MSERTHLNCHSSNATSQILLREDDEEEEESVTIQWCAVAPKNQDEMGIFTFQATLKESGEIVFTYDHIPKVGAISSTYVVIVSFFRLETRA